MVGVGIFTLGGEFLARSNIISILYIYYWSFHLTALSHVWWMVCGLMAWSGLLVLVVKCVGKFSLPEGGFIILFLVFLRHNGGFWYTSGA